MEVERAENDWPDGADVTMFDTNNTLIAVGRYDANTKRLHPRVVLTQGNE
jgi:hypothetical protein